METKPCTRCNKEQSLKEYANNRKQCNECINKRHEYYNNNKDKHKKWDRRHYEKHQENEKAYRAVQIECPICRIMIRKYKKTNHEKTKRHLHNLTNPDNLKLTNKQKEQQQQTEKEKHKDKERQRHQQTIDYLNSNFPFFQKNRNTTTQTQTLSQQPQRNIKQENKKQQSNISNHNINEKQSNLPPDLQPFTPQNPCFTIFSHIWENKKCSKPPTSHKDTLKRN